MHCWEFHHQLHDRRYQWYWRALTDAGKIHSQSERKFETFLQALEDARRNGFDQELHEWYLATPSSSPCLKTVEDKRRAARGGRGS